MEDEDLFPDVICKVMSTPQRQILRNIWDSNYIKLKADLSKFLAEGVQSLKEEDVALVTLNKFIIPFNLAVIEDGICEKIKTNKYTVICVYGENDNAPGFAYTVGLLQKFDVELLCGATNIDPRIIGGIVDDLAAHLRDGGSLDNAPKDLITLRDDVVGRYRIDMFPITKAALEYLKLVTSLETIKPSDKVAVLRLPDVNNVLPGEEGYDESFVQIDLSS